ncbi:predicted protein [Histoplasma mississippiense (nom. inval.)]|uniref:predicted protein n=1 Tax=Ajellomyces capsulatus (strain NAm1 / WU24) TaxID=2059318 RepID=UPI000157D38F|nr:predicted protein [Histoplasma mississippiense (nom. inval.)]EDN04523.1 predicted protein [Histoplasma mississippiense (nom. inval.)]
MDEPWFNLCTTTAMARVADNAAMICDSWKGSLPHASRVPINPEETRTALSFDRCSATYDKQDLLDLNSKAMVERSSGMAVTVDGQDKRVLVPIASNLGRRRAGYIFNLKFFLVIIRQLYIIIIYLKSKLLDVSAKIACQASSTRNCSLLLLMHGVLSIRVTSLKAQPFDLQG